MSDQRKTPETARLIIDQVNTWRATAIKKLAEDLGVYSEGPVIEVAARLKVVVEGTYGHQYELKWKIVPPHQLVRGVVHESFLALVDHSTNTYDRVSRTLRVVWDPDMVISSKYLN